MLTTLALISLTILTTVFLLKNIICGINREEDLAQDVIIPIGGHKEDIEFILREAVNKVRWKNENHEIICVDKGMDEETQKICKLMSKDYNFVHLEENKRSD